jgi:CheY-like chemotaxis protein
MSRVLSGSPVPRHTVFILADGVFVVQWDETRVQDLLSGQYRNYSDHDFGHVITDYELNQLKAAGRVEHFNRQYVWLYALPEHGRFPGEHEFAGAPRVRSYYLNTTLPASNLERVEQELARLNLQDKFLARVRGDLVAILGKNGAPFRQLKDAERAQKFLSTRETDVFGSTAIAFIETADRDYGYKLPVDHQQTQVNLQAVIDSQTDVTFTAGKCALVLASSEEERLAIRDLLVQMQMDVVLGGSAEEGLQLLEDTNPDLLVMDMQLPDKHGWELLAKIKEIGTFQTLPKIMIADHQSSADNQAFALTVGKVDVYLVRPISMAQLRQNIWLTLKGDSDAGS